jgi:hypothetical protein
MLHHLRPDQPVTVVDRHAARGVLVRQADIAIGCNLHPRVMHFIRRQLDPGFLHVRIASVLEPDATIRIHADLDKAIMQQRAQLAKRSRMIVTEAP